MKILRLMFAALIAAFLGSTVLGTAQAAPAPVGAGLAIDGASKVDTTSIRYRRSYGRPVYRHRVYHARPVYRRRVVRPVYYYPVRPVYRRCVMRPRTVWTPYGFQRRLVRVCR